MGELPLSKKPEKGAIVVQENQNGMMEEAFRGLRTNMLFMLGASQKVVLFTSTQPGEGKSFIAGIRQSVWPIWVRKLLLWVWISASLG